ncbi:MAG: hypothetical protein JWN29_485 [Acidimicrobiales bacterium]|jgi:hypothetical protein|nr:hypothetical protein [Acidimicrobiales bacterium]
MIWLLTRSIVWPVKAAGYGVAAGYKTGRLFGYRRVTVFLLGVAIGLLLAPVPGRELRAMLKERLLPTPPIPLPPVRDQEQVDLTLRA